jgi:hypothetical protein
VIDSLGLECQELFKKEHNNKKNSYSDIIKLIPETVSSILDEDYMKTVDLLVQKRIMVRPLC